MGEWSEGYFTNDGYTFGYYREINPVFQKFCLLLRGYDVLPASVNDVHCELGFGQGISVNFHAAANPGSYIATDFNPSHALNAQELANASQADIKLFDDSFEQLLSRKDLPRFDSISLHGIWTWVNTENHKIIIEFLRRNLKPGGLAYISYNCFPGWAPAHPLRQMFAMHDRFVNSLRDTKQRVNTAIDFSRSLLGNNPKYAQIVPFLNKRLDDISAKDTNYLAHEYFNHEWNCMYFIDVLDALEQAKLDWACTANPLDGFDAVNLNEQSSKFLSAIEHPLFREQTRDYFVNRQFRKDLFVRGARRLNNALWREKLLNTLLVLTRPLDGLELKVNGALGEASLKPEISEQILSVLNSFDTGMFTIRDFVSKMQSTDWSKIVEYIMLLVDMDLVSPCQDQLQVVDAAPNCERLNKYLCKRASFSGDINYLVSPVTAGGVPVSRFEQMFIAQMESGYKTPQEIGQNAWDLLNSHGELIVKDAKVLDTPEKNLSELEAQATAFQQQKVPLLKRLRVI